MAAGSLVLSAISLVISLPAFSEAIARVQIARREAQGLPLREGEIEFMQTALPAFSAGMLVLGIAFVLLCRERPS
ncbi:MAG: hypothetical protein H0T56_01020 [Pseudaminobacter sp.]|nr:hypothetical protein [Pseudaminobacter sp.]